MSRPRYTTERIDPATLAPADRAALADALYACHRTIFDGVDRAAFAAYVIDSPAAETRILVLRDTDGAVQGYAALHVFHQAHVGRPMIIVRMEIGATPAFRRCNFAAPFIMGHALRLAARYPGRPRYFFASFVHPSAYVSLCRHAPRVWPGPERCTPVVIEALMHSLERRFGLRGTGRGTVDVGWIARGCGHRPARQSPEARFYLERNPGYTRGEGLVTVIDFGTPAVLRGSLDYLRHRIDRRWRGRRSRPDHSAAPSARSSGSSSPSSSSTSQNAQYSGGRASSH